jgi:hypothetical protein
MTTAVPVRPGHLRDAAEKIEHDTGLRVQIIDLPDRIGLPGFR